MLTINGVALAGVTTGLSASMSASIFKKINELRADPYNKVKEFAESENMTAKLPVWIESLKDKSFKAVDFNPELLKTSLAHINDMSEKNYFSETNADGMGPSERISNAGVSYLFAGEALGIVLFRNYIDNAYAEKSLLKTVIEYELAKSSPDESVIFNENTTDIAVSVKPGIFMANGRMFNAYMAVCDGTVSDMTPAGKKIADMLTVMINQVRIKPMEVLESKDYIDRTSVDYDDVFHTALQKIDYNRDEFAKYSVNRLSESGYYVIRKNDLDVESLVNFKMNIEIDLQQNKESDTAQDLSVYNINSITENMLDVFLKYEFMSENQIILNQNLNRIFVESSIVQGNEDENVKIVVTLNIAAWSEVSEQLQTSGVVFSDIDGDGLYDPGEERALAPIFFFDKGLHAKTDLAGGYYAHIDDLSFWLVIFDEEKGLVLNSSENLKKNEFSLVNLNEIKL